jgi:hypothetical protein
MAKILKIGISDKDQWHRIPSNSYERKLFHILTPISLLADKRTNAYVSRITSEYGAS